MTGAARSLVYLHGMPGGPGEFALLAPPALAAATLVPDCNHPGWELPGFEDPVILIGFSLGAFRALQLAARLGDRISELHLVSPAAPLQLGQFLPDMAGGPIFRLAANRPGLFRILARAQGLLARYAPALLFDRLFASAVGGDAALARDPEFRRAMIAVLRDGLGRQSRGFAGEIIEYVGDWRATLSQVHQPVTIWQGDQDNWTPPAMARALAAELADVRASHFLAGASHYSALAHALKALAPGNLA